MASELEQVLENLLVPDNNVIQQVCRNYGPIESRSSYACDFSYVDQLSVLRPYSPPKYVLFLNTWDRIP